MKLYFINHSCLFAVEQMMMAPRNAVFRGDPLVSPSSAELNSASGKIFPGGKNACGAPCGAGVTLSADWRKHG